MTDSEIVNSKLLQDANIIVNNIYDLVNTKEAYPEAIHGNYSGGKTGGKIFLAVNSVSLRLG